MDSSHYIKVAKKLIAEASLPIQIVDILEDESGDLLVYIKQLNKADIRRFKEELEASLGLRVTLQTIGGRELASLIGGIGRCDQTLCCHRWLAAPLNVPGDALEKAGLSGIPADYLGVCGKLLCCLLYEDEAFKLDCAYGEAIRKKLAAEPAAVRQKVAEVKSEEVKRPKRVLRRVLK